MVIAVMLQLFPLTANPQTKPKNPPASTRANSIKISAEQPVPTVNMSPSSSLMISKHRTNPACTASSPVNSNPCGAMRKLHRSRSARATAQDLTLSESQIVGTITPLDRNDFDPIGIKPFVISPEIPDVALVRINGVETAVQSARIVHPMSQTAESTSNGPTITSYSPNFGNPGTVVTINGAGFGSPQANSRVTVFSVETYSYTAWPAQTWTDTQIVTTVPSNMPLGNVYFNIFVAGALLPGTYPFEVGIPPTITSYSPGFGLPGTHVTINGTGFGPPTSTSHVSTISEVTNTWASWPAVSWTDTQIVVAVPPGFPQGRVEMHVFVNGLESIGTSPFTVGIPPEIDCYSPVFGPPGTLVTINGKGFGATQGSSVVQVLSRTTNTWIGWPAATWSDTQITLAVPADEPEGQYYFSVVVDNLRSIGTFPFEVGFPPVISSYSPGWGNPGTQITINGSGFGQSQGTSVLQALSSVTNTWTNLPVKSWNDTQLIVTIPETMPLGKVYLDVIVGVLESIGTFPFTVGIPPFITSYSPNTGPAGTIITINGTGFGATQGSSVVTLQSVTNIYTSLTVLAWSDTQVTVSIPKLTPTCLSYLSITVNGLQSIGTLPFQVTSK